MNVPFIHHRLFLGSAKEAKQFNFKHRICIASEKTCTGAEYGIILRDSDKVSRVQFENAMEQARLAITTALQKYPDEPIIVHCFAGINRSVAALVHFAKINNGIPPRLSISYLKRMNASKRNLPALTNPTFKRYLISDSSYWCSWLNFY